MDGFTEDKRSRAVLGAGAVVVYEGRVLLVQVGYGPAKGGWILPGGYVDAGESPEEAAVREVAEETGMEVRIERPVAVRHRKLSRDTVDHDVYWVFSARLKQETGLPEEKLRFQREELLDARFWPLGEALESEKVRPVTRFLIARATHASELAGGDAPPPSLPGNLDPDVDRIYFF